MTIDLRNPADLAGSYQCADRTLRLTAHGMFLHAVLERRGEECEHGLAVRVGERLAMAFGPRDKMEIGIYRIQPGTLTGRWVPPAAVGEDLRILGTEQHTPGERGLWTISQAVSITGEVYRGTLRITPPGEAVGVSRVSMIWTLEDGVYDTFALRNGQDIFACFCLSDGAHGVAMYEIAGNQLRGWRTDSTHARIDAETFIRQ